MKIIKRILILILIILIIVAGIGAIVIREGYNMYKEALEKEPLDSKIESIKQKEGYAKIEEVPQMYIDAVIAVEDHKFYKHKGIDIIAIGRAIINNIKEKSLVEGGSTITQQLAKNIYFTQEKKLNRKIAEIFMAFEIEKNCEKDEILELYFNTSYYGDGYYTVKKACKRIF